MYYPVGMTWLPRIREVGWFVTGHDGPAGSYRYADRHLFVRLQQDLNGSGEWTLELRECHRAADGHVSRVYGDEHDARATLACIYALSKHLASGGVEGNDLVGTGRWEIRSYDLSDADRSQLARVIPSPR
jgi:hypothetical protein